MRGMRRLFESFLTQSLLVVAIAIVVLALSAAGAFLYGAAVFINGIIEIAGHPFPVGNKIGIFLLDIDLFLIGATLLISQPCRDPDDGFEAGPRGDGRRLGPTRSPSRVG